MRIASWVRALAVDFDGTLTTGDRPAVAVLSALAEFRAAGRCAVLVTGRIWEELLGVFPDAAAHFDLIVAENGGVLVGNHVLRPLADPVDPLLDEGLRALRVPFRRGRVLLATHAEYGPQVAEVAQRLAVECQLVRNRGELMILPSGVSKGVGIVRALDEAGLSHHNAIAVGDAENDYSLLAACELGVAVANAVEHLRERADLVTTQPNGAGIVELLSGDLVAGDRRISPARWHIEVGTTVSGDAVRIPASGTRLLIAGPSASGKSYVAGLVAERLIRLGYTVLVSDPEGDHERLGELPGVVRLGGGEPVADPERIVHLLAHRATSVVLDLIGVPDAELDDLFAHLPPVVEAFRAATGRPHWVVIDEAHHALGHCGPARPFYTPGHSFCVVTYQPDQLPDEVIATLGVSLLLPGTVVSERLERLAGWPAGVEQSLVSLHPGQVLVLRRASADRGAGPPALQVTTLAARETLHVRHRHKYVIELVPPERRFYFRGPAGAPTGRVAGNLAELHRELARCSDDVLRHHVQAGDLSRWLGDVFADEELAAAVRELEAEADVTGTAPLDELRTALLLAIETRYFAPPRPPVALGGSPPVSRR